MKLCVIARGGVFNPFGIRNVQAMRKSKYNQARERGGDEHPILIVIQHDKSFEDIKVESRERERESEV